MPRPQRYHTDVLLDAAADILAEQGPAAVSMSAVARAAGAPSGSMYHRFPTRSALCAALWLRSHQRFQDGLLEAVSSAGEPQESCVAGARFTVRWCRDTPAQAQVMLAGADALGRDDWPEEAISRYTQMREELLRIVVDLATRSDFDRVVAALIDIPYATVRRHLVGGREVPADAEKMVEDCARALIPRT